MNESKGVVFGSSIIVPSVMELTKKNVDVVPPRYIRADLDETIASDSSVSTVPSIDIQALLSGSMEELQKLDSAAKSWGFFQVVNHGVSSTLVETIKSETHSFFRLSFEEKKKLWQQPGQVEGFGQLFVLSEEQKLDWSDMFYMTTFPTILRQPDLFAKLPQPLRHALESYSLEMKNLAIAIMGKMAEALKIDAKEMSEMFSDAFQSMRLNYYPICSQPNQVIGFTPHSDSDALTILLQLNGTEGLQIRKAEKWLPVKPLQNAFVVNVGDIMEILSNGVYRSIEHRVMVNSSKERLSVATFLAPNMDANVGPAESLISPDNPALFQTIPLREYLKGHFAKKLDGKAYLDDNRQSEFK